MAVQGAVVVEPELLEEHRWPEQALRRFLGLAYNFRGSLAAEAFDQTARARMQVSVVLVGHYLMKVVGNGADVTVDRPLVIVQHDDEAFGRVPDVVQRLKRNAVGEGGIARHSDNVFAGASEIARDCHAQGGRERGARVSGAVSVVL